MKSFRAYTNTTNFEDELNEALQQLGHRAKTCFVNCKNSIIAEEQEEQ